MLWLVGAAVYLICEAVAAARLPGYSYIADYISDLGVSAVMNFGAFARTVRCFLVGGGRPDAHLLDGGMGRLGFSARGGRERRGQHRGRHIP